MLKNRKLFYFCYLKKLVRPETFGPYYVDAAYSVLRGEHLNCATHGFISVSEVCLVVCVLGELYFSF